MTQSGRQTKRSTRLPAVVYVIGAGIFLMGTTEFMIAGLLPETAADLGVDVARAGLLITAFAIGMIIGPPVMALATVRLPARATLMGALAVFAAGHVVAAVSDSFTVVAATRFVTALATGTFWAVGAVVAAKAAGPGNSARALAVMSGGLSLAVIAGVPIGTFAGQLSGWRGPFWMLAVLAAATIAAVAMVAPATADEGAHTVSIRAELSTLRERRMWVVLGAITLAQAGFLGAYSFITPLLTERARIPTALVPVVLIVFGLGALGGTLVGGRFGDRRPLVTVITAISLTTAALLMLAAVADHPVLVVVLVVVLGASGLGANPVLIAQTLSYAGRQSALASSLATAAFNLGTAGGSALAAVTLSTAVGLAGPAMLGALLTGCALVPVGVLVVASQVKQHHARPCPAAVS
ncbi:MFS transporter [Mycobacterium aquaticum]|uniref:MFS transporter n=1 Tax=Mycobacterium aquaticum TaxID=1927124 RepID=A0A1X0BAJ1_9MYCO|nr:MFS transporter [Mycobacterium aquaticum]ORA39324.1 MFS transporter [Mycobacterium aquaticum]